VVYPLVGNMNLAGDLQRLYAGVQAGLGCVAHRVAIFRRHHGGERVSGLKCEENSLIESK
jgi:hypothetical protein